MTQTPMTKSKRRQIYELIEVGIRTDPLSRAIDLTLIGLIALNVLAVVVESVPAIGGRYHGVLNTFEIFSVIVFTIEYLIRVWAAVEDKRSADHSAVTGRIRYMLTPLALIDLAVIAPFYIGFLAGIDLRAFRVFRLFRVFKLVRYSPTMSLLLEVLKDEARAITASLFILALLIVLAASLIFFAEHDAQPDVFTSIPASMWWAVVTMTTVGYGDVVPVTVWGKVLGAVIGVIGIGMVALPAGFLAAGFGEALHRRRKKYENLVAQVLHDGKVSADERTHLEDTRARLGLTADEAEGILEEEEIRQVREETCPSCGAALPDHVHKSCLKKPEKYGKRLSDWA